MQILTIEIQAVLMIEIKIQKQKCIFESFFVPDIGGYYSYMIDIIPKMEYNVLEREVYSLCI